MVGGTMPRVRKHEQERTIRPYVQQIKTVDYKKKGITDRSTNIKDSTGQMLKKSR